MNKENGSIIRTTITDVEKYKGFFNKFTRSFKSDDEFKQRFYKEKIEHSYDVAKINVDLGKKLNFKEDVMNFLYVIGLFHDIGRFKQFGEFNTVSDKEVDHGDVAADLIPGLEVFKSLPKQDIDVIQAVIKQHNKSEIDKKYEGEIFKLCNMLRDSDKLSLFPFFIDNFKRIKKYCKKTLSDDYSSSLIKKIISREKFYFSDTETIKEFKLYILSWINDIYFDESKKIIKKNSYITKILFDFHKNENVKKLEQHFCELI